MPHAVIRFRHVLVLKGLTAEFIVEIRKILPRILIHFPFEQIPQFSDLEYVEEFEVCVSDE